MLYLRKAVAPKCAPTRAEAMSETVTELSALRERVAAWKRQGLRVGLVPTMGNLHAGHFSLVKLAREHADKGVATGLFIPPHLGPTDNSPASQPQPKADPQDLEAPGGKRGRQPTDRERYRSGRENAERLGGTGITAWLPGQQSSAK